MARQPVLPKLAIPSLAPPAGVSRAQGTEEKQPLTAVERGRGMQVPPTPVVVPPTPVGGANDTQDSAGNQEAEGKVQKQQGAEVADEPDTENFVIAESPEEDDQIDGWPNVGSTTGGVVKDSSSSHGKITSPDGDKKRNEVEKKGSIPTGRSRSRSGSSSSQCMSCSCG